MVIIDLNDMGIRVDQLEITVEDHGKKIAAVARRQRLEEKRQGKKLAVLQEMTVQGKHQDENHNHNIYWPPRYMCVVITSIS